MDSFWITRTAGFWAGSIELINYHIYQYVILINAVRRPVVQPGLVDAVGLTMETDSETVHNSLPAVWLRNGIE
jgi:hypothetical protein